MRARIVLPESSQIADLPPFNWKWPLLVFGIRSPLVLEGPAANAGTIGFKVQPAMKFAGRGAIGGSRFGGEQLGEEIGNGLWPGGMMVATGHTWRPKRGCSFSAGAKILAVELIEARSGQAQFVSRLASREFTRAMTGQQMADDRSGQAFDEL